MGISKMLRNVGASIVAAILLFVAAGSGLASAADRSDTAKTEQLPVVSVMPDSGATIVRPDTAIQVQLDTSSKEWKQTRNEFDNEKYGVRLSDGNHVIWFLPTGPGKDAYEKELKSNDTKDARITVSPNVQWDDGTATVTVKPDTLSRYTEYSVILAVGDALSKLLVADLKNGAVAEGKLPKGLLPDKNAYTWSFETGSAIGEPTRVSAVAEQQKPKVTDGGRIDVRVEDDYGNPATMGSAQIAGQPAAGESLDPSFAVDPAAVQFSEQNPGLFAVAVTDHKAQTVDVAVNVTGPWPEDAHQAIAELAFQPGDPAKATVSTPDTMAVGSTAQVSGFVTDIYDNSVLDGTVLHLSATEGSVDATASTNGGAFQANYTAPTRLSGTPGQGDTVIVSVSADQGNVLADKSLMVNPGDPASVTLSASKTEIPADGKTTVDLTGSVADSYGNAVLDGTPVNLNVNGDGSVYPDTAMTSGGKFSATFTAGKQAGQTIVTANAGNSNSAVDIKLYSSSARVARLGVGESSSTSYTVMSNGSVLAWGFGWYGNLGNGVMYASSSLPIQASIEDAKAVAAGPDMAYVLKSDGTVWAWGWNRNGDLGNGTTTPSMAPVQVKHLTDIVAIASGAGSGYALRKDGTVWAWGWNRYGQLGDGTEIDKYTPVQVKGLNNVVAIAAGDDFALALKADGSVWAWGADYTGQLGIAGNVTGVELMPVQVSNIRNAVAIAAGVSTGYALLQDGTVLAWGNNNFGQVGDGTQVTRKTPIQVTGLSGVVAISGGGLSGYALAKDGSVWAWGRNNLGQLGDGSTINRLTPVKVQGISEIASIAGFYVNGYALKEDGTVWAWGYNGAGQLGNGSTVSFSSVPVQVRLP